MRIIFCCHFIPIAKDIQQVLQQMVLCFFWQGYSSLLSPILNLKKLHNGYLLRPVYRSLFHYALIKVPHCFKRTRGRRNNAAQSPTARTKIVFQSAASAAHGYGKTLRQMSYFQQMEFSPTSTIGCVIFYPF